MKFIVDKMPEQPKDCLFCLFRMEYGWTCKLTKYTCRLFENLDCLYLKQEEEGE